MMPEPMTAIQAMLSAQEAFRSGDKRSARRWAELASTLDPALEDPWLLLAAVSTPRASVMFLERALQVNPGSVRAQKGMQWALKRVQAEAAQPAEQPLPQPPAEATQPNRPVTAEITQPVSRPAATQKVIAARPSQPVVAGVVREKPARRTAGLSLALLFVACMVVAALIWIDASPARAFINSLSGPRPNGEVNWAPALVAKTDATVFPTLTPLPSATAAEMTSGQPESSSQVTSVPADSLPATAMPLPTINMEVPSSTPAPTEEPSPTPLPTDMPSSAPAAQPVPNYGGSKRIVVSISEQHLYAYDGDTLVYSFVASTGMHGATRVGAFSVLDKIPNAYGSTWNIWMPNWLGIYYAGSLENGIHALPILSNGQRLWAGYLGTPISFGCIVLGVSESEQLYNWADVGTPVIIQY